MFIGHYGLSYIVKKKSEDIPLWLLFTSVQLLDLIAFTLVLFGIEQASYTESGNPFFRNFLYLPYSHSLAGAVIISLLVFGIFWLKDKKTWAWILGLCVLSHWFIDLIVHVGDLSLFFGSVNVGPGLWNFPALSFVAELVLLLGGWFFLKQKNLYSIILLVLMTATFSGMFFSEEPQLMKQNAFLRTSIVLFSNAIFILFAYLFDQNIKKKKKKVIL